MCLRSSTPPPHPPSSSSPTTTPETTRNPKDESCTFCCATDPSQAEAMETVDSRSLEEILGSIPPPPPPAMTNEPGAPRLMITHLVNRNFKSYAGEQILGPFHKVWPNMGMSFIPGRANTLNLFDRISCVMSLFIVWIFFCISYFIYLLFCYTLLLKTQLLKRVIAKFLRFFFFLSNNKNKCKMSQSSILILLVNLSTSRDLLLFPHFHLIMTLFKLLLFHSVLLTQFPLQLDSTHETLTTLTWNAFTITDFLR